MSENKNELFPCKTYSTNEIDCWHISTEWNFPIEYHIWFDAIRFYYISSSSPVVSLIKPWKFGWHHETWYKQWLYDTHCWLHTHINNVWLNCFDSLLLDSLHLIVSSGLFGHGLLALKTDWTSTVLSETIHEPLISLWLWKKCEIWLNNFIWTFWIDACCYISCFIYSFII